MRCPPVDGINESPRLPADFGSVQVVWPCSRAVASKNPGFLLQFDPAAWILGRNKACIGIEVKSYPRCLRDPQEGTLMTRTARVGTPLGRIAAWGRKVATRLRPFPAGVPEATLAEGTRPDSGVVARPPSAMAHGYDDA